VSGGTWERRGAAWTNNVFAYNVSVGCNHCADPACAAACPTNAYTVRGDGIVWLEEEKCVGCAYCAWACPYGAPQYSRDLGRTTKCDFCRDLIDEGLLPACVAACPMRALDLVEAVEGTQPEAAMYPLSGASRTRPQVTIKPHPAMLNGLPKSVANVEEVRPAASRRASELSLVAFTLFGQTAAGIAVLSLVAQPQSRPVLAIVGALIAAAALVSLLHLGTASRAWLTPANARRSPLSREILMLGIFAAAWAFALLVPSWGPIALALAGAAFVFSMAEVYRLDAVPAWTTWRTRAAFAISALLLGGAVVAAIRWRASPLPFWTVVAAGLALVAQQFMTRRRFYERLREKAM
jgi:anaerobic dimethyl sulfoxide reductase subunit B (iron-sulfur subunit)